MWMCASLGTTTKRYTGVKQTTYIVPHVWFDVNSTKKLLALLASYVLVKVEYSLFPVRVMIVWGYKHI